MTYTTSDYLIDFLISADIKVVFGVPGGAIEPFFNSIHERQLIGDIKLVVARSESAAAFMADGYYRTTGKLAAVCSTAGPGTTNLITGVASGYMENIPMFVITPQTPLAKFGKFSLQDSSCSSIDTVAMFKNITAYSTLVSSASQIDHKVTIAYQKMLNNKKPVHLSIPSDVMRSPSDKTKLCCNNIINETTPFYNFDLCKKLKESEKILICVGSDCSGYGEILDELINKHDVPYICSPSAKGYVNEISLLFKGVYGFGGHVSADSAILECDLLLLFGSSISELDTKGWNENLLANKTIHIDESFDNLYRSGSCGMRIKADIHNVITSFSDDMFESHLGDWSGNLALNDIKGYSGDAVCPGDLMKSLSSTLDDSANVFIDAGNSWAWSIHYYLTKGFSGKYHIAMNFGSMAWSIGASIGSAYATRSTNDSRTIAIIGDGSFLMGSNEFSVAIENDLPIAFLILNDGELGMVRHGQLMGGQRSIGWQLPNINYADLAKSMGAVGVEIDSIEDFELLEWNTIFSNGPAIIDVRIDTGSIPPMGDRIQGLGDSVTPGG